MFARRAQVLSIKYTLITHCVFLLVLTDVLRRVHNLEAAADEPLSHNYLVSDGVARPSLSGVRRLLLLYPPPTTAW